jgi:hypothetical protein
MPCIIQQDFLRRSVYVIKFRWVGVNPQLLKFLQGFSPDDLLFAQLHNTIFAKNTGIREREKSDGHYSG